MSSKYVGPSLELTPRFAKIIKTPRIPFSSKRDETILLSGENDQEPSRSYYF